MFPEYSVTNHPRYSRALLGRGAGPGLDATQNGRQRLGDNVRIVGHLCAQPVTVGQAEKPTTAKSPWGATQLVTYCLCRYKPLAARRHVE